MIIRSLTPEGSSYVGFTYKWTGRKRRIKRTVLCPGRTKEEIRKWKRKIETATEHTTSAQKSN